MTFIFYILLCLSGTLRMHIHIICSKMHIFLGFWNYVRDSKISTDLEEKIKGWRESKFQKILDKIYYISDIDLDKDT